MARQALVGLWSGASKRGYSRIGAIEMMGKNPYGFWGSAGDLDVSDCPVLSCETWASASPQRSGSTCVLLARIDSVPGWR